VSLYTTTADAPLRDTPGHTFKLAAGDGDGSVTVLPLLRDAPADS
jgi:hypothetical protein